MNKFLYTIGLALTFSLGVMAQDTVNGIVKDPSGKPLSGVKVSKVGEFRNNSVTDNSGAFSLVLEEGDFIELNYADVVMKRVRATGNAMNITLDSKRDATVDMGFLKRTEETQTQSATAIYADFLEKNATSPSRVNNAFFGL